MHFLRLRLIAQVGTALRWGSILKKTKKWSSIMISWIKPVLTYKYHIASIFCLEKILQHQGKFVGIEVCGTT